MRWRLGRDAMTPEHQNALNVHSTQLRRWQYPGNEEAKSCQDVQGL